jgi:hypothetical protein
MLAEIRLSVEIMKRALSDFVVNCKLNVETAFWPIRVVIGIVSRLS